MGNNNRLYTKLYDKAEAYYVIGKRAMISTFTLSTFHSCRVIYHTALHMVFKFHNLSDLKDDAHTV